MQVLFGSQENENDDNEKEDEPDKDNKDAQRTAHVSTTTSLAQLMQSDQLQYASREPAINIYRDGGAFDAHQDDQTLTALVCLSTPDVDFQGGGTAFWTPRSRNSAPPRWVMRPPAGAVLLFGGTVTHAAQAVTAGCRVMAVASFSPLDPNDSDGEPTYLY